MKQTLLELVQSILSDMGGDEVNSISDTAESEQVASVVRSTYNAIVSHTVWPHTRRAVVLDPRSNSEYPTHMVVKEALKELISIHYNKAKVGEGRKNYKEVAYCTPDDFLRKTNYRDNTKSNIDIVIDDSGIELFIQNDKAPDFYTSFDDSGLVFDSYDKAVDSTLQQSKLQAQGYIIPEFLLEDDFVPDLPADAFSLLLEESTSRAQFKLRQFQDMKSEQESQKQSRFLSQKSWTVAGGIRYRNYGRNKARVQGLQPWSDG